MNKFAITISMEMPGQDGTEAIDRVTRFFNTLLVGGQKCQFVIDDIRVVKPDVPQED